MLHDIAHQHDARLLILAAIVCVLASSVSLKLFDLARSTSGRTQFGWLASAAFVTGSGIWTTHFVSMLGYRPGLTIGYDFGLTFLSILIAIATSAAGYWTALRLQRFALGGALLG